MLYMPRRTHVIELFYDEQISTYTTFLTPARVSRKLDYTTEFDRFRTLYMNSLKPMPSKSLNLPVSLSYSFVSGDLPPHRDAGALLVISQHGPARLAARDACRAA